MGHFYGCLGYAHLWVATQGFEILHHFTCLLPKRATTSHMGSV